MQIREAATSSRAPDSEFGEWGNYKGIEPGQLYDVWGANEYGEPARFIDMIPTKDWDPDTTAPIIHDGCVLSGKRHGRFTLVSPARARKPTGSEEDMKRIYQQIISGEDLSIPVASESGLMDNPLCSSPRYADLRSHQAVAIVNRYSPFVTQIHPALEAAIRERKEELRNTGYRTIPEGVCLVAFPTHYEDQLESADPENVTAMLLALQKGLVYVTSAAQQAGVGQQVISVFINTHKDTARSIPWLHTQAWIEWTGDGHGESMELWLQRAERNGRNSGCSSCNCFGPGFSDSRRLYQNKGFMLYVPSYRETSHELAFIHREHAPDMLHASDQLVGDLADVLQKGSIGLTRAGQPSARHVEIYQRPVGYVTDAHWSGRITPNERYGGFERMDRGRVSRSTPEQLGNRLKPYFSFN